MLDCSQMTFEQMEDLVRSIRNEVLHRTAKWTVPANGRAFNATLEYLGDLAEQSPIEISLQPYQESCECSGGHEPDCIYR